ncbi:secreted protein [Bathymodiolus azoricus thioautotrophic gill symbiont]|uniref:Secreted protein n=1 Tax=Bathymodiolus azoricus thioautotrophic gill symbiont TaxID=235205 RepID=A0A1H6LQJ1_9GAMM|nr:secreted protein [Bathymodiolus azoricus thioautotrophic gill symbiont]
MAGELVASLAGALCVVFIAFAQDMGADVQGATLLFCLVG